MQTTPEEDQSTNVKFKQLQEQLKPRNLPKDTIEFSVQTTPRIKETTIYH